MTIRSLRNGLLLALLASSPVWAQGQRGTLSALGSVAAETVGMGTASITVSGTYSGTVSFEVIAGPGTAAVTVDCATPAAPGTAVNSTTSTGVWVCPVAGMSSIQARMSSYTSGTATIDILTAASPGQSVAAAGGGGSFDGVLLDAPGGDAVTDTVNNAINVNVVAGAAGGTEYIEAATDATIAGVAMMMEGAANALVPAQGTAADGLLVNLGTNNDVVATNGGTFVVQENGAALTALQLIDNAISGAGFNITQMNGVNVSMGVGASGTGTQRVAALIHDGTDTALVDASGNLQITGAVSCSNCTGSGASDVEGSTYTLGTDSVAPLGGYRDDTGTTTLTEDRIGLARLTEYRALHVNLRDASGNALTLASDAVLGTATYTEATTSGPVIGAVRNDTLAALANTDNEIAPLQVDANGALWTRSLDACSGTAKTHIPINISTATTTELTSALAGASNNYYICSLDIVTAGANNIALVDDDSDGCGSVTSGLAGGTSASSGWNFAANGGMAKGNGEGTVFKTGGTNRVVCLVTSAAVQVSGSIQVVAAP